MTAAVSIPAELRERDQWVVWRLEQRDGKQTKVPYCAADPERRASTTDASTWATFADAVAASDWGVADGIGFVFTDSDPYCGVDLDAALPESDRGAIMLALDSYAEFSVSGAGAHVIVRACFPPGARNRKGPVEVYDRRRYFVVTGAHIRGTPTTIEDRQGELEDVLARYLPAAPPAPPRPPSPVELDDRDLLERAFAAKNGADLRALLAGEWQSRYGSQSEADLALCSRLAFWFGRDPDRIAAVFRSSGLMRAKWERADYRDTTIAKAIAATTDVYTSGDATPSPTRPDPPLETTESPFAIATVTARELCQLPEPDGDAQLLGPYVTRGARTIIVADTGEGKTTTIAQFVRGIVTGDDVLGYAGAGEAPAVILDLEQGLRSAKRAVRVAGLDERDDVHIARCPDGLALDREVEHVTALRALLDRLRPVVVALDPYYKAYRDLEPNEEHGVVELMRFLDRLRVEYGFALILGAHPRKDQPGRVGIRRLTIHDVAGSGALTRGAEVVLGIERGNPGFARLRVLKDRDGDLPVGNAIDLVFDVEHGFRLDPREQVEQDELDRRALEFAGDGQWRTSREFAEALGIKKGKRTTAMLDRLTDDGKLEYAVGPEGRRANAKCWRISASGGWRHLGAPGQITVPGTSPGVTAPTAPGGIKDPRGSEAVIPPSPCDSVSVEAPGGSTPLAGQIDVYEAIDHATNGGAPAA